MTVALRQRSARAVPARAQLLDTAERLFAEHGIDGVSLRQIAAEAGQGNNSVVQYHFGDKAGLIHEIIARRRESFEPRRQALLEEAIRSNRTSEVRALLEVLFVPLVETVDGEGQHVYARFIVQYLARFQHEDGIVTAWAAGSAGAEAGRLLAERLSFLDPAGLVSRVSRVSGLFLNALLESDGAVERGRKGSGEGTLLSDTFAMMAAAMEVPLPARTGAAGRSRRAGRGRRAR